jgi:hypothetical protein
MPTKIQYKRRRAEEIRTLPPLKAAKPSPDKKVEMRDRFKIRSPLADAELRKYRMGKMGQLWSLLCLSAFELISSLARLVRRQHVVPVCRDTKKPTECYATTPSEPKNNEMGYEGCCLRYGMEWSRTVALRRGSPRRAPAMLYGCGEFPLTRQTHLGAAADWVRAEKLVQCLYSRLSVGDGSCLAVMDSIESMRRDLTCQARELGRRKDED